MQFEPDRLTRELVLDAVKKIEDEKIRLIPSTKYDVVINGKPYPPKDILRYAHELMNGENIWLRPGGPPTNSYLARMGFTIENKSRESMSPDFTGKVWKLGCRWETGSPYFYDLLKANEVVVGVNHLLYAAGDLILVTDGFTAMSIVMIEEAPVSITTIPDLKEDFEKMEIPYEDNINVSNVQWYELPLDDRFSYELRAGIRQIQNKEVKQKVIDLWNNRFSKMTTDITMTQSSSGPKNIILYGPPGTGKTYNSIDKAVEIATGISGKHEENKIRFDELRQQGRIEFVTFHQSYAYEDFVVGITPDISTDVLRFKKREGIFKALVDKAKQNWIAAFNPAAAVVDFTTVFNHLFSPLIEEEVPEIEIPMRTKSYRFKVTSINVDEGRIKFTKQSGGTGHDLLVSTLKSIYEGTLDYGTEGLGVYYYPLVEKLREQAAELLKETPEKEPLQKYVLIIDEINRANISKVFGELITLLEEDKRLGAPNELRVTLPNGERDFGIPPNLYVIGTMNTADKSIALIDIALRRRFEFIGYYPKYTDYDANAAALLRKINNKVFQMKKSADYLIGHAYFMGEQSIASVLQHKVVPLLMEYFSGKTDFVTSVFADTGWKVNYNTDEFIWNIMPVMHD